MSAQNADSSGDVPTVISTFAGCGGSSLGYKLAGFRELLAVEWDDNAVKSEWFVHRNIGIRALRISFANMMLGTRARWKQSGKA